MTDYEVLEVVDLAVPDEPSEDDAFKDLALVRGIEEDGYFDFVRIRGGYMKYHEKPDGSVELMKDVNHSKDYSKTVCSRDKLGILRDAINELCENIDLDEEEEKQ